MQQSEPQTMLEIRSVRPRTLARIVMLVTTTVYLLIGCLALVFVLVVGDGFIRDVAGDTIEPFSLLMAWLAGALGVLIVSYIVGWIAGLIYNITSRWWGGVTIHLVQPLGLNKETSDNMQQPPTEQSAQEPLPPVRKTRRRK